MVTPDGGCQFWHLISRFFHVIRARKTIEICINYAPMSTSLPGSHFDRAVAGRGHARNQLRIAAVGTLAKGLVPHTMNSFRPSGAKSFIGIISRFKFVLLGLLFVLAL